LFYLVALELVTLRRRSEAEASKGDKPGCISAVQPSRLGQRRSAPL